MDPASRPQHTQPDAASSVTRDVALTVVSSLASSTGLPPLGTLSTVAPKGLDPADCASEPIHIPGAIQPHGALLAASAETLRITHASANLEAILGFDAQSVLGLSLQDVVGKTAFSALQHTKAGQRTALGQIDAPGSSERPLYLHAHWSDRHVCIDIEPASNEPGQITPVTVVQSVTERFKHATSISELCGLAVAGLKAITQYDRVMVYRFGEDGHGEVIAEAHAEHLEPYLGNHYPTTDIPPQARAQFMRQRVGSVSDSAYRPVKLLVSETLDDGSPLDLARSTLRSVSPIHCEFMRNMGTAASLSIGVSYSSELWGVLICNHSKPRVAGPELRASVDMIGQVFSLLIPGLEEAELSQQRLDRTATITHLTTCLAAPQPLHEILIAAELELLRLVNASGAAVRVAGTLFRLGRMPELAVVERTVATLQSHDVGQESGAAGRIMAIDDLSVRYPDLRESAAIGSGVLFLPLTQDMADLIVWYRPELSRIVTWAGNPATPHVIDPASGGPSPRASFAAWTQRVERHSAPWTTADLAVAHELREAIGTAVARRAKADLTWLAHYQGLSKELELNVQHQTHLLSAEVDSRAKVEGALASALAEVDLGKADLRASVLELAASRTATSSGQFDLAESAVALESARAETDVILTKLVASAVALASSRAETQAGHAELMASAVALASSRAETSKGQVGLVASGVVNKALKLANVLLETNEAVLEKLVEERTAALMREIEERHRAEETLRQGEKLQAIGQITGGIAHDFNNILQVVVGGVELLRQPRLTDERHTVWLEKIDKAAESAKVLTGRLLTFARKQALQPKVFNLNERLAGMSELLRPMLGPNIRLENDFAPDLWPVMADPNQLEVAILNLAVNARDAMPPDGGVLTFQTQNVTLKATSERAAGEYICLAVRDTGAGMSPAVMAHVFEPFFTTKGIGKGTGLGLAQVYGFAKQSCGDITVESAPGQGTTIYFHLLRPTPTALASASKNEELQNVGSTHHGSGKTVLVVDDNLDLADLTASMLEGSGYVTKSAATAAEALALIDAGEAIDCVFSDIVMPGPMNGLQLADTLRHRYPQLAVVLATGYSRALTEGIDQVSAEVLSKPYRGRELTAALDRAFSDVLTRVQ